jgi:hypothetical protein
VAKARGGSIEERLERSLVGVFQRRSDEFAAHEFEEVAQLFASCLVRSSTSNGKKLFVQKALEGGIFLLGLTV